MTFSLKIDDSFVVIGNICSLSKISQDKKSNKFQFYINLMDGNGYKASFTDEIRAQKARLKVVKAIDNYTSYLCGGNHGRPSE